MNDVRREQQGNLEAGLGDGDLLHRPVPVGAGAVEQRAEAPVANGLDLLLRRRGRQGRVGGRRRSRRIDRGIDAELPGFFLEGHLLDQMIDRSEPLVGGRDSHAFVHLGIFRWLQ